jgi:hypothetical protein
MRFCQRLYTFKRLSVRSGAKKGSDLACTDSNYYNHCSLYYNHCSVYNKEGRRES